MSRTCSASADIYWAFSKCSWSHSIVSFTLLSPKPSPLAAAKDKERDKEKSKEKENERERCVYLILQRSQLAVFLTCQVFSF